LTLAPTLSWVATFAYVTETLGVVNPSPVITVLTVLLPTLIWVVLRLTLAPTLTAELKLAVVDETKVAVIIELPLALPTLIWEAVMYYYRHLIVYQRWRMLRIQRYHKPIVFRWW